MSAKTHPLFAPLLRSGGRRPEIYETGILAPVKTFVAVRVTRGEGEYLVCRDGFELTSAPFVPFLIPARSPPALFPHPMPTSSLTLDLRVTAAR